MSGTKDRNDELEIAPSAFEFVVGTMRGTDRKKFEKELYTNMELQKAVQFWEDKLMPMSSSEQRAPATDTWEKISRQIKKSEVIEKQPRFSFTNFWQWAAPSIAAVALMFVLFGYYPNSIVTSPNTDYVAVLTSEDGKPYLTAITAEDGKQMWLKWEVSEFDRDANVQLWAKSKRDGEIRPISVFDNTATTSLDLTTTTWRLITDAESLILTEEEPGGSAIDEPSDVLLAQGVCVRFSKDKQTI